MAEQTATPTGFSRWKIERAPSPSKTVQVLAPIVSVALALVACGLVLLATHQNPISVYHAMLKGALGDRFGFTETLVKTTPLLLAGLGISVAFKMQLWNIGAEGQIYLGAIGATWIAIFVLPDAGGWIVIPVMAVAGMIAGGIWGAIPGVLRAVFNANETITTLMLNYVAIILCDYLIHGPWKDPNGHGFPGTARFSKSASLPRLMPYRVHLGLAFGLAAALILWIALRRTRWGYELNVMGSNSRAARYAGMNITRTIVLVMAVSGALAGLAGMSEVSGIGHQLQRNLSPGYGYTAIIVAWLGRLDPFGIILVSFLLAGLLVGGDQLQMAMNLPSSVAPMLQGAILFFVLGGDAFTKYQIVRRD
jgi:general nucleoside transport system permease protein